MTQAVAEKEAVQQEVRAQVRARFDVIVKEAHLEVLADMPGVSRDSVEVTLEAGVLDIKGERADYDGARRKDYHCSFTLGTEVDTEGIKAGVTGGVLTVTIPKAKNAGARKIKVKG